MCILPGESTIINSHTNYGFRSPLPEESCKKTFLKINQVMVIDPGT